jgi:hypothetical protein
LNSRTRKYRPLVPRVNDLSKVPDTDPDGKSLLFSFEQRVNGSNDDVIGRIEFDRFPEWRTYEVKLPNLDPGLVALVLASFARFSGGAARVAVARVFLLDALPIAQVNRRGHVSNRDFNCAVDKWSSARGHLLIDEFGGSYPPIQPSTT